MTEDIGPRPPPTSRRDRVGLLCALAVSLASTLAFALLLRQRSHFQDDDFVVFRDVFTQSLGQFLLQPSDLHFIPLHRLAGLLIYSIAPLNFDLALAVMGALHLLSVWMLYRTLDLLSPSLLNGPLTVLWGTSIYVGAILLWWTAGIARFPCILLSIAAVYQFIMFRMTGSMVRLAMTGTCLVLASAFFSKGLLIPGLLGAVELALFPDTPRRQLTRNLAAIGALGGVAVAYRILSNLVIADTFHSQPVNVTEQLEGLRIAGMILSQGVAGLLWSHPLSVGNWLVLGIWFVCFLASVLVDRFNGVVWVLGVSVVAVNFLAITLSPRMVFGPIVVTVERYYPDVIFVVVLFAKLLAERMTRRMTVPTGRRLSAGVAIAWVAVLLASVQSQETFRQILTFPLYVSVPLKRAYVENLKGDLAEIRTKHEGVLRFAPGATPRWLLGFFQSVGDYSKFLPIFDRAVEVSQDGVCVYRLGADGKIEKPPTACSVASDGSAIP